MFFRQNTWAIAVGACCLLLGSAPLECALEIPLLGCWESMGPASNCIEVSHTEGKGLGYSQGYTSLDLFLAQPIYEGQLIPFVDLRGHVFNNGRFATNAGLGFRWLNASCRQMWGVNFFYDSLLTHRQPYHQVSLGLEALGETWDVRINGYLPVGRKKTPIYRLSYDFSSGFLAKAREQFAMSGIDVEIGYHFCNMQCFDLYAGVSPYLYWGRSQKTENAFRAKRKGVIGGRLRTSSTFLTHCELEGVVAYDSRFKWTGQVTLSLNIPFDWSCCFGNQADVYAPCWFQPVIRNEMIVIDRINRFSSNPAILDPEFEP